MENFNRTAYIVALNGLLTAATDEQLDHLWGIAVKLILEQGESADEDLTDLHRPGMRRL